MSKSELLLTSSGLCWGACFMLYLSQIIGSQNIHHKLSTWCIVSLSSFQIILNLLVPFVAFLLINDTRNPKRRWFDHAIEFQKRKVHLYSLMTGTVSLVQFLMILSPFIFITNRTSFHLDRSLSKSMICVLVILDVGGYVLMFLVKYFESCYGLFLGVIAGVMCTCFKGFGEDEHEGVYKGVIGCLCMLMIFFCGTFVSVQEYETRQFEEAAVAIRHDDVNQVQLAVTAN